MGTALQSGCDAMSSYETQSMVTSAQPRQLQDLSDEQKYAPIDTRLFGLARIVPTHFPWARANNAAGEISQGSFRTPKDTGLRCFQALILGRPPHLGRPGKSATKIA